MPRHANDNIVISSVDSMWNDGDLTSRSAGGGPKGEDAMNARHAVLTAFIALSAPVSAWAQSRSLPVNTMIVVTPTAEVSSKHVKVGDPVKLRVATDVTQNGVTVIPAGTPATGTITFKTGRAVGGKSGKFDLTIDSVSLNGRDYKLRGVHRQEGKGNTAAALLASLVISGRSAVMTEGQTANAFTAEAIAY